MILFLVALSLTSHAAFDFTKLGEDYLKSVKSETNNSQLRSTLRETTSEDLAKGLQNDSARKAFWLNVYNGLVQEELQKNPKAYLERRSFFDQNFLVLKDVSLSLNDIEHGILRRSKSLYSLGYFERFFPANWEKKLRVDILDPRIHFALNCGAESCPAIYFYTEKKISEQLDLATVTFLTNDVSYDPKLNSAKVTRLFLWFNGDFGGHSGIVSMLEKFLKIPVNKNTLFHYKPYDWNLILGKYGKD